MTYVVIPLTGAGDATAQVATEQPGGPGTPQYQIMKLADGTPGSTVTGANAILGTITVGGGSMTVGQGAAAPSSAPWQVTGSISVSSGSIALTSGSAQIGAVAQATAGSSNNFFWVQGTSAASTSIDANLTSAGSTKEVGTVRQGAGSTTIAPWYVISSGGGAGSTTVDANLTSVGSTKLLGKVDVNSITSSTANIGNVSVSSGVVLGAGSSANVIGQVAISSGNALALSSGTQTIGTVQYGSAASTGTLGVMQLSSGTQTIGTVAYGSAASTGTLGVMSLASGTSGQFQFVQSIPFSSANVARSSVSTTVDIQIIAANANRKALVIANRSTAQTVGLGFSTGVTTTGLANVDVFLAPSAALSFGIHGGLPLYLGPIRGINLTSTAVAGSVGVTEFT